MKLGVLDAGVAIGWVLRGHRSLSKLERLFASCRSRKQRLVISVVNLVEVIKHTSEAARAVGHDPLVLLRAQGVEVHLPDEVIARRVAKLATSLADGFAAATAQELGARLHTTDAELVAQLKGTRLSITRY